MKTLELTQMENLQGGGLSPECLASMGGSAVLSGIFLGPVGYVGGAIGVYLYSPNGK